MAGGADGEMKRAIALSLGVSRVPEAKEFLDGLDENTVSRPAEKAA